MSTISERATASIRPIPRDATDMGRLREEWRLAAKQWVAAQDAADRLEEGRKMVMAELILEFTKGGMPRTKAEDEARTSQKFKEYVRRFHDAKRLANDLRIDAKDKELAYWEQNNSEATQRAERRMSR